MKYMISKKYHVLVQKKLQKTYTVCRENKTVYRQHMIREMSERGLNVSLFNNLKFLGKENYQIHPGTQKNLG